MVKISQCIAEEAHALGFTDLKHKKIEVTN